MKIYSPSLGLYSPPKDGWDCGLSPWSSIAPLVTKVWGVAAPAWVWPARRLHYVAFRWIGMAGPPRTTTIEAGLADILSCDILSCCISLCINMHEMVFARMRAEYH